MEPKISQLQNVYAYLEKAGIGASATSSGDNFMNTIWSSIQDVENIAGGDDQQKVAGIQKLLSKALDLIGDLAGSKESAKAKKEVKKNGSDVSQLNKEATDKEAQLVEDIEKIKNELNGQISVIETASQNVEGKKDELEKQLEALKTIQEQIEQKQQALKNAKPEDRAGILNDIQTLASLVPAITGTLTSIQESFETESQNVANAYTAVEVLKGNAVELQTNGQEQIIALSSKAGEEINDNLQSNQTAKLENDPTAIAAEKSATAANSNIFTASQAPKLFRVSADQEMASTTRITGSQVNLQSLQQGIGKINSSNAALTGFAGDIEQQLNTLNTAIGHWDETINPMIESIGSVNYEEIGTAADELQETAQADIETLNKNNSEEKNSDNQVNLRTTEFDLSRLGIVKKEEK